jgi:hypothetical protein
MKKLWWFILGRCRFCGGDVWDWDCKKSFCNSCEQKQ